MQTVDFRLELLFILLFVSTVAGGVIAVVLLLRSRPAAAKRVMAPLGAIWILYFAILIVVAATTKQKVVPRGEELCWDEMCYAVAGVETLPEIGAARKPAQESDIFYAVTIETKNTGRGRAQREIGLRGELWTPEQRYSVSAEGQAAWDASHANTAIDGRIDAGSSIRSTLVFEIPCGTSPRGVVLSNGFTPGYFVIGESPVLHPPTILSLQ